jgi:hypothetical protein
MVISVNDGAGRIAQLHLERSINCSIGRRRRENHGASGNHTSPKQLGFAQDNQSNTTRAAVKG